MDKRQYYIAFLYSCSWGKLSLFCYRISPRESYIDSTLRASSPLETEISASNNTRSRVSHYMAFMVLQVLLDLLTLRRNSWNYLLIATIGSFPRLYFNKLLNIFLNSPIIYIFFLGFYSKVYRFSLDNFPLGFQSLGI